MLKKKQPIVCDLSYIVDWRGNAVTDALGTAREI